jgi:hypothetical protein
MSTIAGAKWCGFSVKQYDKLQCEEKEAGTHRCSNGHTFVWCEGDSGGEKSKHAVCSGVQAYPTWFEQKDDGTYEKEHEGYKGD